MTYNTNSIRPGRDRRRALGALASAAAVASVIIGMQAAAGGPARAAGTTSVTVPPAPASVSVLPYAGGRAYVSWTPGRGAESDSYTVTTYQWTSSGPHVVGTQLAAGTDAVVGGLQPGGGYQFTVSAANGSGTSAATASGGLTAVGLALPGAPTSVSLSAPSGNNDLTLTWTPSAAAPAAEKYAIGVFEGTGASLHQVGAVTCQAPCTSQVITARPGTVTSALLTAQNGVGNSPSVWSNQLTVSQPCTLACLTVSTGTPGSPANQPANGYLVTSGAGNPGSLAPRQWRTNLQTLSQTAPSVLASLQGTTITDVLSDDWFDTHNVSGYAVLPWANWTTYSQWVTSDVTKVEALARQYGFHVAYWEVQNEPFGGYYFANAATPPSSDTIANFEQQFLSAYQAVKAADPAAQVEGPALIAWSDSPLTVATGQIDMRTFLDWAVLQHIQLGAVSFHDNNFLTLPGWYAADGTPAQPQEGSAHVAELRQMLAARPSLGTPAILVNEYGDQYTYQLPGWSVGRIAALDSSGVDGANRSCWNGCGASLDSILSDDGTTPLPGYWVYNFYSQMTGRKVPVTTTYDAVSGVGAVDPTGAVRVLVGRHQSCDPILFGWCPASSGPAPATVSVQVPGATTAVVTMAAIPMGSSATATLPALNTTSTTVAVSNGVATISTPNLADGDAAEITVVKAS